MADLLTFIQSFFWFCWQVGVVISRDRMVDNWLISMDDYRLRRFVGLVLGLGILVGLSPQGLAVPPHLLSQGISSVAVPEAVEERLIEGIDQGIKGNYKEAIRLFSSLIRDYPRYPDAYYNRGIAQSKLGNQKSAIADHTLAIKMNAEFAEAHQALGFLLLEVGDKTQGMKHLEIAAQLYQKQNNTIAHSRLTKQLQSIR